MTLNFPVFEYFKEIKVRFIYLILIFLTLFLCATFFFEECIYLYSSSFFLVSNKLNLITNNFIYTHLPEAFFLSINISFFIACYFSFPFFIFHIFIFSLSGLFKYERKYIINIFVLFFLFFYLGGYIILKLFFPFILKIFLIFETNNTLFKLFLIPKISDYIYFCQKLIFLISFLFPFPIYLSFLIKLNIISLDILIKNRFIIWIIICLIISIISPPEVLIQVILSLIFFLFYELIIIIFLWKHLLINS